MLSCAARLRPELARPPRVAIQLGSVRTQQKHLPREGVKRLVARADIAVAILMAGILTLAFVRTKADPDLWGHLRFGLDLLETGQVVRGDTYSYVTGDQTWVNHEWLAEGMMAGTFERAGAAGLILLKISLMLLIAATLYIHFRRNGLSTKGGAFLLVPVMSLLWPWSESIRPQLFSYLGFALVLSILDRAAASPRALWWLPVVFALWVNLHGGFLAGLAFVALWAVLRVANAWRSSAQKGRACARALVAPVSATLAATLVNPYTVHLLIFLRTALVARPEIDEWHPLHPIGAGGIAYVGLLALAIVALAKSRKRDVAHVGLLIAAAILPLTARRHLPLFAIAVGMLVARYAATAWPRFREGSAPVKRRRAIALIPAAVGVVAALLATPGFKAVEVETDFYPVRAVQAIKDSGVEGQLAVSFDWGEYALWHLWPRMKVSVDGRRETVYSEAVYRETCDFMYGTGDWDRLLHRGADVVLVGPRFPTYNLMKLKRGWSIAYEDSVAAVFAPTGSSTFARLTAASRRLPKEPRTTFP